MPTKVICPGCGALVVAWLGPGTRCACGQEFKINLIRQGKVAYCQVERRG